MEKASQLSIGTKIEAEHKRTIKFIKDSFGRLKRFPKDKEIFQKIASDHIDEIKDYYTRLIELEKQADKDKKRPDIEIDVIKFLIENPNPKDKEVHDFAESKGIDPDELEPVFYKLATERAEMSKDMQKARNVKYLRRWKSADGKWRYLYRDSFLNPFSALLSLFSFKKEKVSEKYQKLQIKDKYDIDEKTFASHLLEYLSNRKKWDTVFSGEKKERTKTEKKENKKQKKQSISDGKISFNRNVMKEIYFMFNEPKEKKIEENIEEKIAEEVKNKETKEIPDKFKNSKPEKLELEVVSIGRKYLKVRYPGKNFEMDLYLTKETEGFNPGESIKIDVLKNVERNNYGTKTQLYPVSDENKEELQKDFNQSEIERWMGYVRKAARDGYIYDKGITKLQELGVDQIESLSEELNTIKKEVRDRKTIQKIDNYLRYMQEAADKGYVYRNGLATLKELKIEQYPEKEKKLNMILEQLESKKEKEQEERQRQGKGRTLYPNSTAPPLNTPIKIGNNIIIYEKAGKSFRINEDMPSIYFETLGHEGEYGSYYYYRNANEDEIQKYNEAKQKKEEKQKAEQELSTLKSKIASIVKEEGVYVEPDSDSLIVLHGKKYFDSTNIYGGGSYFLVDNEKKYLWYVKNNGMDGDNWSNNNIRTGGAGAIGYRIPYNKDMQDKFEKLIISDAAFEQLEKMQKAISYGLMQKAKDTSKLLKAFHKEFDNNKKIFIKKLNPETGKVEYRKVK